MKKEIMPTEIDPNELRSQGFRMTPQRLTILQILEEKGGHLTPVEIFQFARQRLPGLTEATVYRTLEFLTEHGLALVAHIGNGRLIYETAHHHHHHLVCRECGHTADIDYSALEDLYEHFRARTGFKIDASHVVFFGSCPHCLEGPCPDEPQKSD